MYTRIYGIIVPVECLIFNKQNMKTFGNMVWYNYNGYRTGNEARRLFRPKQTAIQCPELRTFFSVDISVWRFYREWHTCVKCNWA